MELKRLRADRETILSQSEKERDALRDSLAAAQHEAQRALRAALTDHQEELERLTNQKVIRALASALFMSLIIHKSD